MRTAILLVLPFCNKQIRIILGVFQNRNPSSLAILQYGIEIKLFQNSNPVSLAILQ
ncbi:hypothetical protein [Bizionia echini]|uniref:hypothetical protein n=1 Tax=Bizionia echini TaxID=649333 RepID=UPI0015A6E1E3|nr:hypothetical protein [Bizionia echini]